MAASNLPEQMGLEQLVLRRRISIPQLAQTLNISPHTATSVVGRLVKQGLAKRSQPVVKKRGRPACIYTLKLPGPTAAFKVDGTQLNGALLDPMLNILAQREAEYAQLDNLEEAAALVAKMFDELIRDASVQRAHLPCAVVSIHALRIGDHTMTSSVLPWADGSMEMVFTDALKLPVRLTGVRNRYLVAEYQKWLDLSPDCMAKLHVGDGVSAHVFTHQQTHEGASALAGELGHIILDPDGPLCGCGRRGCIEAMCSGPAISHRIINELCTGITSQLDWSRLRTISSRQIMDDVWQAWRDGDSYARATMQPILDNLGRGLSFVLNLLDPDLITLGGYVLENRPDWIDRVRESAKPWTLHAAKRNNRIEAARATIEDELRVVACTAYYPL